MLMSIRSPKKNIKNAPTPIAITSVILFGEAGSLGTSGMSGFLVWIAIRFARASAPIIEIKVTSESLFVVVPEVAGVVVLEVVLV